LANRSEKDKLRKDSAKLELFTIEELAQKHNVPSWTLVGMKAAFGWGAGKKMSEADFMKAKDEWLSGPMRRKVK
jgi:hypothetical protein